MGLDSRLNDVAVERLPVGGLQFQRVAHFREREIAQFELDSHVGEDVSLALGLLVHFSQERIDNCVVRGSMPGCGAFLDAYSLYGPNGAKLVFDNVYYRITMQVAN